MVFQEPWEARGGGRRPGRGTYSSCSLPSVLTAAGNSCSSLWFRSLWGRPAVRAADSRRAEPHELGSGLPRGGLSGCRWRATLAAFGVLMSPSRSTPLVRGRPDQQTEPRGPSEMWAQGPTAPEPSPLVEAASQALGTSVTGRGRRVRGRSLTPCHQFLGFWKAPRVLASAPTLSPSIRVSCASHVAAGGRLGPALE